METVTAPAADAAAPATEAAKIRNDAATFVKTWQAAKNAQEVADKLGINKNSVLARATKFRKEYGVALKKMERGGGRRLDVDALKALVAESTPVQG